jgi:hypothetical protein
MKNIAPPNSALKEQFKQLLKIEQEQFKKEQQLPPAPQSINFGEQFKLFLKQYQRFIGYSYAILGMGVTMGLVLAISTKPSKSKDENIK